MALADREFKAHGAGLPCASSPVTATVCVDADGLVTYLSTPIRPDIGFDGSQQRDETGPAGSGRAAGVGALVGCGANTTEAAWPPPSKVVPLHSQFWTTMPFNMAGVFSGLTPRT